MVMPALEQQYETFRRRNEQAPAFVRALRERGFARFGALGFPTVKQEDWKYTSVAPLAGREFAVPDPTPPAAATALVSAARLDTGAELVFVNGTFVPALSSAAALPAGVIAGSLADALRAHPDLVEPHLGRHAELDDDGLAALNTAFVADGAFIRVPDGVVVETPIHCLFVSATANGATVSHPRNLVIAGAASRLTVIEQYTGGDPQAYWTNAVTEAALANGATLVHHRLQRESEAAFHIASLAAGQAADSQFRSHAVSFGAGLSRTAIATRLDAPGAGCVLDGLYVAAGTQHVDHHTTIDHRQPRGTSRELYKGIMGGHATGVFNGKVFVRTDAQQSDAQQMNKNLLLSDDAQVDTKPQLEILADDVKCSHGATIGQLDDDAVFYLRARGIDEPMARELLIYAFANELIERVAVEPLRAALARALGAKLREHVALSREGEGWGEGE
jgi:Fe-S cluster assembly protein SufD